MPIKIGSYKLDSNILLAPLTGCADLSFRLISREHGAKFCFYEMVDVNSLIYGSVKNTDILKSHKDDKPIAGQLIGSDADSMFKAAKILLGLVDISFLDINAACPVKKMTKKFSGAHLVRDPETLHKMIEKLASNLTLPITVKLRTGYEETAKNIAGIAKNCEKAGASAIFIHGRTRAQAYSGAIDYESIRAVKENVSVPVFGSGNVMGPELAKKMLDATGCDGILVARGAFGNPWIFKSIEHYLKTGRILPKPTIEERIKVLKKHLAYIEKFSTSRNKSKVGFMRKMATWYLKHFPKSAIMRGNISKIMTYKDLISYIDSVKLV